MPINDKRTIVELLNDAYDIANNAIRVTVSGGTSGSSLWEQTGTDLHPLDPNVKTITLDNTSYGYTEFMIKNEDDTSNFTGAILELKGSGADYTNNAYFGKYGSSFWIPELADSATLFTDNKLNIGTVDNTQNINFIVGDSYTNLNIISELNVSGFSYINDLSSLNTTNDRWIPDKGYIDNLVDSNTYWTSGSSGNNSLSTKANISSGGDARGDYSIATGFNTSASGSYSFSRGYRTSASGTYSTASGYYSTASGNYSTASGYNITASNNFSNVFGDSSNSLADYSTVFGYNNNINSGAINSFIGAGRNNTITSRYSAILGGWGNTASGHGSFVVGGVYNNEGFPASRPNQATNYSASVISGNGNTASGANSAIGGQNNTASGANSFVYGSGNNIGGQLNIVFGMNNTATGSYSFIAGGNNTLTSTQSFIIGNNSTNAGSNSAIIAGQYNTINSSVFNGATIGGEYNTINNRNSIILGGNHITTTQDDTVYMLNMDLNNYTVTGISNDTGLTEDSPYLLATQYAIKTYVDDSRLNRLNFDLGSAVSNGATLYSNAGAGFQYSFAYNSNDEILFNKSLPDIYDGSSYDVIVQADLYSSIPNLNDVVSMSVDYTFLIDGEDGYIQQDGSITQTIDVTGLNPDELYTFNLGEITGKLNAKVLLLTIRRNGNDAKDTYNNSFDILNVYLDRK